MSAAVVVVFLDWMLGSVMFSCDFWLFFVLDCDKVCDV